MFRAEHDRIIERQMRNWEMARGQADSKRAPPQKQHFNFIAISRQKASGGLTLARRLGAELGWQVYDTEIIDYMAGDDALQKRIYQSSDENTEGYLQTLLLGLDLEAHPPRHDYFQKLSRSIHVLAGSAHAVFVGRGAHLILPSRAGLRVRVVAPEFVRIAAYAKDSACSLDDAAQAIRRIDQARDRFIVDHFRVDPKEPHLYDLVINFEYLSLPAAVRIILAALEGKTGYQPGASSSGPGSARERIPEPAMG